MAYIAETITGTDFMNMGTGYPSLTCYTSYTIGRNLMKLFQNLYYGVRNGNRLKVVI